MWILLGFVLHNSDTIRTLINPWVSPCTIYTNIFSCTILVIMTYIWSWPILRERKWFFFPKIAICTPLARSSSISCILHNRISYPVIDPIDFIFLSLCRQNFFTEKYVYIDMSRSASQTMHRSLAFSCPSLFPSFRRWWPRVSEIKIHTTFLFLQKESFY